MKRMFYGIVLCALATQFCAFGSTDLANRIKQVCQDEHVKVVWTRAPNGSLGFPQSAPNYEGAELLMGFDTDKGKVDTLLLTMRNYQKPLMCHSGKRIVFSDCSAKKMYLVTWDDSAGEPKELGSGVAGALLYDEKTGREYVIYSGNCTDRSSGLFGNCQVIKMNIDSTADSTIIYNENRLKPVSATWLCISGDGKALGCVWEWNKYAGAFDITQKPPVDMVIADGCWSTMPCDSTHRYVEQDRQHRGWEVYDPRPNGFADTVRGHLLPAGSGIGCNMIRIPSYSADLFLYSTGMSPDAAEKGGRLKLVRTDSTLAKLVDSVTITQELMDGFGDLWKSGVPVSIKFQTSRGKTTTIDWKKALKDKETRFFSLSGRAVNRETIAGRIAANFFIAKVGNESRLVQGSEIIGVKR